MKRVTLLLISQCHIAAILLSASLLSAAIVLIPQVAQAQVVYSLGVQQIYDDNIFLENKRGTPPPFVVDDQLADEPLPIPPIQANGDPDSDFITNIFAGASGAISLSRHLSTSAEGKIGALIFADESDENRLTLDALITSSTKDTLLPDPFFVSTSAGLQSRANDVTVADGTATRQAQTFVADLNAGVRDIALSQKTKLGGGYRLGYTNFLGNFTFGSEDEEAPEEFQSRFRERGADYLSNSLDSTLTHNFSERLIGNTYVGVTDFHFIKIQNADLQERSKGEFDRLEGRTGAGLKYRISEQLEASGTIGINANRYSERPEERTFQLVLEDGSTATIVRQADKNTSALTFGASLSYAPEKVSSIKIGAEQASSTDLDGDRVLSRTFSLDAARAFGDRFKTTAGGRFLQFNIGDTLSNPTERYEFTIALSYSVTEFVAVVGGWNYANQKADKKNIDQLLFGSDDYEVNRFFIGVTGGLVGLKS